MCIADGKRKTFANTRASSLPRTAGTSRSVSKPTSGYLPSSSRRPYCDPTSCAEKVRFALLSKEVQFFNIGLLLALPLNCVDKC